MPGQLNRVLDAIDGWPRLAGAAYGWGAPPPDPAVGAYLGSMSAWRLVGFELTPEDRARIAAVWKRRPDLRELLGDVIGYAVYPEFKAAFLRQILDGGRGDVARWLAAYPDLAEPLWRYFEARTRRFNHPLDVVDAVAVATRYLGAEPELWYAAAFALNADHRRVRDAGDRQPFLRADLDTASRLTDPERRAINQALAEIGAQDPEWTRGPTADWGGPPAEIDGLALDAWWHPQPLARGDLLARVASASMAAGGADWGLADLERYARALAALDPVDRGRFVADNELLRRIRMRSAELVAR